VLHMHAKRKGISGVSERQSYRKGPEFEANSGAMVEQTAILIGEGSAGPIKQEVLEPESELAGSPS
jgi:hypothetical protein